MENILLTLFEISVSSAVVIVAVVLLSSLINRNYTAKWKYWLWLIMAARLIIPFNPSLESAPVRMEVNIPTAPVNIAPIPIRPAAPVVPAVPNIQPAPAASSVTVMDMLAVIWICGVILFVLYQAFGYAAFHRHIIRWGLPVPKDSRFAALKHQTEMALGVRQDIPALICRDVSSPMMTGFFKPLLILPQTDYDDMILSYILRHELTHYKRRDIFYKALMLTANAVHWFNPAAWLMVKEASRDLEISCDAAVMMDADMLERKQYSETILSCIHRESGVRTALSTHFYGGQKTMMERFENILSTKKRRKGTAAFMAVLIVSSLAGGLIACGTEDEEEPQNISSEYEQPSETTPEEQIMLSEQTANEFIGEVLSTLTVHEDDIVSFSLPGSIPTDPENKTRLMITMNTTYVIEAGVYSVERFLDNETEWSGGDTYTADLKTGEGEADRIMLRVAFMTEVGENAYREYAADYVELIAPFAYETSAVPREVSSFSQDGENFTALYTTSEGRRFDVYLSLPEGMKAASLSEYPEFGADEILSGYEPIIMVKNGEAVGSLTPVRFAATDEETIAQVKQSAANFPMAVYASVAFSNMVEWNTDSLESYYNGGTVSCVNYPKVNGDVIADCVLAYNADSEPYFIYLNFKAGVLTAGELSEIAGSVVLPPRSGIYAIAAEGTGDGYAPDQSQMPQEHGWAGEEEREYYQNIIDSLDLSLVNTFVAKSSPSDEEKAVELSDEQAKAFFDLLKSIELTAMEPENPATGGSFTLYIVTADDQLTFSHNGNWFTVSRKGQDKWWIFDGRCAQEQFGAMQSEVYRLIHSEMFEEPSANFPVDGSLEWIELQNASVDENYRKIMAERDTVLDMINEKILSFRNGTFVEMPNHHAPWRKDFPAPDSLAYPITHGDFVIVPAYFESTGENSYSEGGIDIWVRLSDKGHYMVLTPAWFGVIGSNEPVLGFSDSGFYHGELTFDFEELAAMQTSA